MKPLLNVLRPDRAKAAVNPRNDDSLGRGMELALTVLLFLGLGWLIDRWLGLFPVFTITLVVLASVGMFGSMKLNYDATMERHEAELRAGRATTSGADRSELEDAA